MAEPVELSPSDWLVAHMAGDGCLARVTAADGATSFLSGGIDCTLHLHTGATLSLVNTAGCGHHEAGLTALAASQTGTCFASGCEDGAVRLFAYPSTQLLAMPTRFSLPVRALALSPDGNTLVAGGDDEEIRVVDVSNPEECKVAHTLKHPAQQSLRSCAFNPLVRPLLHADNPGVPTATPRDDPGL
jgi:WD40 repeat protein